MVPSYPKDIHFLLIDEGVILKPSKVLVIGSGPIIIGQAVEALSSGNQTYAVQPLPEYRRKEAR